MLRCVIPAFVKEYVSVTSWFRDDTIILPGRDGVGGRYVVTSNGYLHIRSAEPEDGVSRYSCLTIHSLTGERRRSATATLTVTDPTGSMPPRLTQRIVTSLSTEQGTDVHLSCAAQGNPPPTFTWLREVAGQLRPVTPSLRVTPAQDVLHIRHAGPEDAGRWVCRVANQFGEQRLDTQLSVTAPLRVHVQPQLQVINSGEAATFNCSVSGSPVDAVHWLRNTEPVTNGGLGGRVRLLAPHVLHVSGVTRHDRGMYQCFARNERESAQGSAELRLGDTMPELQSTFIEQTLSPGPHVSLRCSATGSPPPEFKWALDGETLTAVSVGHRFTIGQYVDQAGDVISHVNITSTRAQDGGLYSCSATNSLGRVTHSARLNIYGSPAIRVIGPVRAIAGENVTLHCPYSGHPISAINWERQGQALPPDMRYHKSERGTLTISRIEAELDAGNYVCLVQGAGGEVAHREILLTVNSPPVIEPFFFPSNLQEGGRAQVSCSISSGDLPIRFSWLKDGDPLSPSLQVEVEEKESKAFFSLLIFNKVSSRHSGFYMCVASNIASSVNFTAQLLVKVAPKWVMEPHNVATLAGDSLAIHCQAQGFPEPRVIWLRQRDGLSLDYIPLEFSGSHIIMASNGSILISSAGPHDEGNYLCRADNGIGAGLSKVVAVSVNEPVTFDVTSRNVTARRGDAVKLMCEARGDNPIQVDWFFNGQRLQHSYRSSLSEVKLKSGLQSQLVVGRSDRHNSGQYVCKAGNIFGRSELSINLAVQEPPDPPLDVQVIEVGSRSVRLSWRTPFDGHSALLGYLVQYKPALSRADDWQHSGAMNLSVPAAESDFTVKNMDAPHIALLSGLHPATTYHVRMLAINGIEPSSFIDPIAVKTQEEAPVGSPRDVLVETIGPNELLVTWKPPLPEMWNGELLGYNIHWSVHGVTHTNENHTNSHTVRGIAVNEFHLTDLRKFTRYDISVGAFNSIGSGPQSLPVTATTQEGVPEAAPQNVTCSALSSQSVKVNWSPPPTGLHGGLLQGYKVVYRPVLTDRTLHVAGSEVKRTSSQETYLHGLLKYTNYSVRLLAYTSVGDGILSDPVHCTTEQDVPGPPSAAKALALTSDSILVSWLPPEHPNGQIVHYTVYVNEGGRASKPSTFQVRVGPNIDTVFEVRSLTELQRYEFWVTAATIVGEGDGTRPTVQTPNSRAPARIASFSQLLRHAVQSSATLPCVAVGNPTPTTRWLHRREPLVIESTSEYRIMAHGALHISKLEKLHEGNYTCLAKNLFGEDQVNYQLLVLTAPGAPNLELDYSSQRSIGVQWSVPDNGGTPIQGFVLSYKRDHGNWQEVPLEADRSMHTFQMLHCGSTYHTYLTAHNRVGNSRPSSVVTATTKGEVPKVPSASSLLSANASSIHLLLSTWPDGGCPILYFVIEYRLLAGDEEWIVVNKNATTGPFLLKDVQPGTWYQLRLTAYNDAGFTKAHFSMATTTFQGATVSPLDDFNNSVTGAHFYQDVYVMVTTVCVAILLLSIALLTYVTIHRKSCQRVMGYKCGQELPESPSICKEAAEMDNKRNFQQIYSSSPVKTNEQHIPKHADNSSELYEMSPYATFAVPPDPPRVMAAATLDYTVQFKTFGHSENDSSAHHNLPQRSHKKHRHSASDESGRQSALSSGRHRHSNLKHHHTHKTDNTHDSESDSSGSPSAASSYRMPIKKVAARSLELYRLDSSTESNETSPLPERRRTPRHYRACSGERAMQPLTSCESSSAEDDASFSSYRLQPPSGFSDSRELSEAECDRDASQLDKLLARFHHQKEQERLQYTIHV